MKIKIKNFVFAAGVWLTQFVLLACGAGGPGWTDFQTAQFFGAGKITPNSDGTWTLWWPVLAVSEGVTYNVYQSKAGTEFNFEKPLANTASNTYQTADLRLAGNTCFVVRALQNGESVDTNTKEVCTHHEPYSFSGIKELVSLKDGTYMVRWEPPPFSGGVFQVFSKKKDAEKLTPIALTEQSFFQTGKIPLSETVCYVVQHRIQGFPDDKNTKEICTSEEGAGGFAGIEAITSPEKGALKVWWKPSSRDDVSTYRIYIGTTFRKSVATLSADEACSIQTFKEEEREWCSYQESNLPHAASYTYAVRAVDIFEREDDNRKAKTFELLNHEPVVSLVKVIPNVTTGRPAHLTCETNYSDVDTWQTLVPTFVFRNRTRALAHQQEVELQRQTLSAGVKTTKYNLKPTDRHGDLIVCEVLVEDGFGGTHVLKSAPADPTLGIGTSFLIPDTPAIATTIFDLAATDTRPAFLYSVRNTVREVTIALNSGYTDIDADAAQSITITDVVNGNVCLISDASCTVDVVGTQAWTSGGTKTFPCDADGACKFQFVPAKDHFTNPDNLTATLAVVKYQVNIADITLPDGTVSAGSVSATTGEFKFNVRPAPRATGFSFKNGFQDEPYLMSKDPSVVPPEPSSGVLRGFTPGMGWMGFESSLKITKMYTRISTNASDQSSEQPNGEFDVALMTANGDPGIVCKNQTYVQNDLPGAPTKTVKTDCEITCRPPKPGEIDRIYGVSGGLDSAQLATLKADTSLSICPFLFKPDPGFYGSAVFYYSVVDLNGLPSDYARAELNFTPSLRAIGHKIAVVEGETANIEFFERPEESIALTGIDGTSEDVSVVDVIVKDSQVLYIDQPAPMFFTCTAGANTCTAGVPSLSATGGWPGYGHATYIYRLKGWDSKNNKQIFSNWCPGQSAIDPAGCEVDIHFYPKPRATNPEFAVLESSTTQLSFLAGSQTAAMGYYHPYSDSAITLKINNYDDDKGEILSLSGAPAGEVACATGACSISVQTPAAPCGSNWSGCSMNIAYSVVTLAPPDSELGSFARRSIESEIGNATVSVRPVPVPNDMAFVKPEGVPFTITITKGTQPSTNASTGGYIYPINGIDANAVDVVGTIANGNLSGTGFTCTSVACTAVFNPAAGFTGDTSIQFKVSVFDDRLGRNVQSVATGTISIKIRPVVKATGLNDANKIYSVEGFTQDFYVRLGANSTDKRGYTHIENIPAHTVTTVPGSGFVFLTSNSMQMGAVQDRGGGIRFSCDALGACLGTFNPLSVNPDWPGYGEGKFSYNVTVNDPLMGEFTSNTADAFVDVRPIPRAIGDNTKPNGVPVYVTVEGVPRSFSMSLGSGYTHPYNYKASSLQVTEILNGTFADALCDAAGVCSFTYSPTVNYYGTTTVKYKVRALDLFVSFPPFNGAVTSNETTASILVYPRPRATNKDVVGLQNRPINLLLEPNTVSNTNGGYTHPYGDKAYCVKVENLRFGTVTNFSCDAAGRCTSIFSPQTDYYSDGDTDRAGFDYYVIVQKDGVPADTVGLCPDGVTGLPLVMSPKGILNINVRPIPVATGLTVVDKQADTFTIELKHGDNLGYKDRATPSRPASGARFISTVPAATVGTLTPWDCTSELGVCRSNFTPAGSNETAFYGDVDISYAVEMYDAPTGLTVESDSANLRLRVRPRPVGTTIAQAQKQGQNHPASITFSPPLYSHPYNLKAYRVEYRNIAYGILRDSSNLDGFSCDAAGKCDSFFRPQQSAGEYYWGPGAQFEYRMVVNDEILKVAKGNGAGAGDIEGFWMPYTIDYRPVPEPTGLMSKVYLREGGTTSVHLNWGTKAEKKGYAHGDATFHLPPYRAVATPAAGFLGSLGLFTCDPSIDRCTATYTAPVSGTTYGIFDFNYKIFVNDPVLGQLESYTSASAQIQVKPVPKAFNKFVRGVQNANKNIILAPGNGYFYPSEFFPELKEGTPKLEIEKVGSSVGGNLSAFTCDVNTGVCIATFTPATDYTGEARFQFFVRVYDPDLDALTSNTSTYTVDFYPSPIANSLHRDTNNHIIGREGSPRTFSFLPSKIGSDGFPEFCVPAHTSLGLPQGYQHPFCSPAVEIIVDPSSQVNATVTAPFACNAFGQCTGTVTPNALGGTWNGYGDSYFEYKVRINPPELADEILSPAEIANLTSKKATAQVEFYPLPKTKNLEFWAIQDTQYNYELAKCNDTLISDCNLGYVHGYNEPASNVILSNPVNLLFGGPFNCQPSGICSGPVKGATSYFSNQSNAADRASIDYRVVVKGIDSNTSTLYFNVYPKPAPLKFAAEGVQNEELDVLFSPSVAYTHAAGGKASFVALTKPAVGRFVQTANCTEWDAVAETCLKYSCSSTTGICVARFRGFSNTLTHEFYYGTSEPSFRIEMNGPAGMPVAMQSALVTNWEVVSIKILPKPIAQSMYFALKENGSVAVGLRESASTTPTTGTLTGYWHPDDALATSIELVGASAVAGKIPIYGVGSVQKGNMNLPAFDCALGVCSNSFWPLAHVYGEGTLNFKVIVSNDSRLKSDNAGTLTFDIRPVPDSLNTTLVYWPEDEAYPFEIGQANGYYHPYNDGDSSIPYPPKRMTTFSLTNGTVGTWDYTTDPKVAKNTFTPDSSWTPNDTDNRASFMFSVSTDDPKVGVVDSDPFVRGKFEIEYRPKPVTKNVEFTGTENQNITFTIRPGPTFAYTHVYNLKASDIEFKDYVKVTPVSKTCNTTNGQCEVVFQPDADTYGTASAMYRVKVVDDVLPVGKKNIWSDWMNVTIDFRPLPRPVNVVLRSPQDRPLPVSFGVQRTGATYTVAYSHPYYLVSDPNKYVANSFTITGLSHGSFVGSGVTSSSGIYTIPCNTQGLCEATFEPPSGFTGSASFTFMLTVRDLKLNADIQSPVGMGEIRVRPVPIASDFSISAPEVKVNENRPTTIAFGLMSVDGKGYDYPGTSKLAIHDVTILSQTSLNGTLSAINCSGGLCVTNYLPTAGFTGSASFTFQVWSNDPEIGPVSSNSTSRTVSIDVRPRPVVAPFSKAIAENILDHPTTTNVEVVLNNSINAGYRQANNLLAFEIVTSVPVNGTLGAATCVEASGVCTVEFTPTLNFSSANASFSYKVKVRDTALGANPLTNVLESDVGVVTLPVRKRPVATNITAYARQGSNKTVTISKGSSNGYTHDTLDATAVVIRTWDSVRLLQEPAFTCTSGTCLGDFPGKANILGAANVGFQVKVSDPVLGADLLSNTGTAQVIFKGIPKIQGSPHALATVESSPITITFERDNKYSYDDNDNWNSIKNLIRIQLSGADKGTFDGGQTSKLYNCSGEGVCSAIFTPTVDEYGLDALTYTVSVLDPHLGLITSSSPTDGTVNIKIRPKPRTTNVASRQITQNVSGNAAVEGGVLSFVEGTHFTYPYQGDAAEFENMRIVASLPTKGQFYDGSSLVNTITNACSGNTCSVKYVPAVGEIDGASISYKIVVRDRVLNTDLESNPLSTSAIDIYPRPVCNPVTVYATQNETPTVRIAPGASNGYTHARNELASSAVRVASTNSNGDATASVSCSAGNCDFVFTPSPAAFFTSQDGNTKSKFNFKVTVGGVESYAACTAEVVMRPKPVTEPPTGLYVFEGRPTVLSISKSSAVGANSGYYHPYPISGTDYRGRAAAVAVVSSLGGATDSANYNCNTSGTCSITFTPSVIATNTPSNAAGDGVYGAGISNFNYTVKTGAADPWYVISAAGTVSMNLRPVPKISNITTWKIENTNSTFNIGTGVNQYIWGTTAITQVQPNSAEAVAVSGFDAAPTFTCNGSSACTATLATTNNFNRGTTSQTAVFKYRVRTRDSVSNQDVWSHGTDNSTWPTVTVDVAPLPRAQNINFTGIEGVAKNLTISRGASSGYTHVQNLNANALNIVSCTNCATEPVFDCTTTPGTCTTTTPLSPVTTFTDISGEPDSPTLGGNADHTNKAYGWVKIVYTVRVNDPAAGNVTSPQANMWVYFRPVPRPTHLSGSPLTKTDAVEGDSYTFNLIESNGWSYSASTSRKPNSIVVSNVSTSTTGMGVSTVTPGTCASGICPVTINPPATYKRFGTVIFDYQVGTTDNDNVAVSSADKPGAGPGRISVTFRARPRVQNVDNARLTGTTGIYSGKAVETCKADGTHVTTQIPTITISKGGFNDATGNPTGTTGYYHYNDLNATTLTVVSGSESNGNVHSNSCSGVNCDVQWKPRCWNDNENEVTGSFNFRVTDSNGLESTAAATASIVAMPRVRTTGASFTKDSGSPGVSSETKSVSVSHGSSSGYTHIYNGSGKSASSIKIMSGGSGYSSLSPAPNGNGEIACSAGVCTFTVTPSVADANAIIKYRIIDNDGFISKNTGDLTVYFVSRPIATSVSQTVAQGSSGNILTISLGAGYTHPNSEKAVSILITDTTYLRAASGGSLTNTSFTCNSSGVCTATYTPDPTFSTSDPSVPANLAKFSYKIRLANNIDSTTVGTYNIDVYPKPVVREQSYYWVQSMGRYETGVTTAERYRVTLSKGSAAPSAYSTRDSNAYSIEGLNLVTGTGTWIEGLTCTSGTCSGKFQPSSSAYSSTASTIAVRSEYKVRVRIGTTNIDSEPGYLSFYIMPNPSANNVTLQVWEDASQGFRFVQDTSGFGSSPIPIAGFWYPWTTGQTMAVATNPPSPMQASNFNCNYSGGGCYIEVNPNGANPQNSTFTFTFTAAATGNWPLSLTTSPATASVNLRRVLQANDFQTPLVTQILGAPTTVPVTLNRGTEWLDHRNASGTITSVELVSPTGGEQCGTDILQGTLSSFTSSDGGVTWNASFTTTGNNQTSYGYRCYNYVVKRTSGTTLVSNTGRLTVFIRAQDNAAEVCDKTTLGTTYNSVTNLNVGTTVIAYPSQERKVKGKRGGCGTGGWYLDPDNNYTDRAVEIDFPTAPSSGSITGCGGNNCVLACDSYGDCPFTYNPPASTGTVNFSYRIKTQNTQSGAYKWSVASPGKFQVVSPPTPVARNRNVTVLEDAGVPINISATDGLSMQTLREMGLRDGDDGYPWEVKSANWSGCNVGMNINPPMAIPCDIYGNCNITIPTTYDSNSATTCNWTVNVNNVNSNTGQVIATITPVDDSPQTYANNIDLAAAVGVDSNESVHHLSHHAMCWSITDWAATFVNESTEIRIQKATWSNALVTYGTCLYEYGYMERDGDNAVLMMIDTANRTGIGTDQPTTSNSLSGIATSACPAPDSSSQCLKGSAGTVASACDANGRCRGLIRPTAGFVGEARFRYKVKTCFGGNTSLCTWQPTWSTYRLEVANKPPALVPKEGSSTVAQGGVAPIVFTHQYPPGGWNGSTKPTEAGKYYGQDWKSWGSWPWWRTKYASGVVTSNLTGASAVDFTCDWDTGVCVGMFNAAPGFAGSGGFDFQVRANGDNRPGLEKNYVVYSSDTGWGSSLNYFQRLMADSAALRWPVDVKPIPVPTGRDFITAINQALTVRIEMGAGLGYTHAGPSPASGITVKNPSLAGGTLGEFSCDAGGVCTATYTPANNYEGSATFEYYVTDNQSPNKFSSTSSGVVTIQVKPMIIVSNLTRTDLTEGATVSLNLAKQTYPTSGVLTGEGYAHKDGTAASTLTANTFSSGSLSGTGVSCTSGTCTVNCAADGDSDNNRCTFNFVPSSATFYGTATFKYTVTAGGATSTQKDASLTFKARPTLKATALDLTGVDGGIQGQNKTITIDFNSVTTGEYGYTHPTSGKATAITISSMSNTAVVGTPSCDGAGLCTVVMRHTGTSPNNFGATSFAYNVTVGGLEATTARTVNLTFHEVPVSVANKSATTDKDTTIQININKGDEYTLSAAAVATKVVTSNVQNGQTVSVTDGTTAQSDFTCDGSGNCNLKFKPTAGYEGNAASFDFVVYKGAAASVSRKFSVKVDGGPTTTARNLTGGTGGSAQAVTISLGTGYTDPNNDPATSIETQNVTNGVLTTLTCDSAGICTGTFTPNTTFTGNATFQFRVTTTDSTRVSGNTKVSDWATYTLASSAADEAPVATGRTITNTNRTSQSVTIGLGTGYTDSNSDKATALTIVAVDGATTSTPSCNSSTGDCTFNVYTQGGTFGQSVIQYTVTANGKTSNGGIIRLTYASNSASGCVSNLVWSSMTLSDSCGLSLAATPTLSSCTLTSTEGAIRNISTGAVAANSGGVSATLTSFPESNATFTASWKVISDLDDNASLQRTLQLSSSTPSSIRMHPLALTPARAQGMAGLQAPVTGCAGTCTLDYAAAAGSLSSSAGGSLSVGLDFACSANGNDISCWGKNTYGQLGVGNNTDQSYATSVISSALNGANLVAVSSGAEFSCGLLTSGEVACWGRNDVGQLGDMTTTNRNSPVFVKRNASTRLSNIVAIAAGDKHVCAVSGTKTVWCWGDGSYGALGVTDTAARNFAAPVKLSGASTAGNLTNAIAVSAQGNHSCIVQDVSGVQKALCWGRNDLGQLGRGSERNVTVNVSSIDVPTDKFTAVAHGLVNGDAVTLQGSTDIPVGIASATKVYFVRRIDNNTFALLDSTDTSADVLIDSTGTSVRVNKVFPFPAPVKVDATTDLTTVQRISMQTGTTCALLTNGEVHCAGDNTSGATGRNLTSGTTDYATAVRNAGNTANLANVVSLDGGNQHMCALLGTGSVSCWGANASGQLGNGTTTAAALPVSVTSLSGAVAIATGASTSCALVRSVESSVVYGRVHCWGANTSGMLGNGSVGASTSSLGTAVKIDGSTLFNSRLRDCNKIYSVTDLP